MEPLIIKPHKFKTLLVLVMGVFFVLLCIWAINKPSSGSMSFFGKLNDEKIKIAGVVGFLLGSLGIVFGIVKLIQNKPSLIINDEGIYDNSSAAGFGLITWESITAVEIISIHRVEMILIFVNNQEELMARVNWFRQLLFKISISTYGTPIGISTNTMNIEINPLYDIITNKMDEIRKIEDNAEEVG